MQDLRIGIGRALAALGVILLTACGDGGGTAPIDATVEADAAAVIDAADDRFAELAAAIEQERLALGAPGVAVAVLEDGELVWSAGFGHTAPDGDVPTKPTTLFRIASVTKMMTATALLQQVATGDVELDVPVTDYVPGFSLAGDPGLADTVSVRHLLTHASAMYDHIEIDASPTSDSDLSSYLQGPTFASQVYLMAEAGRMYNYSNPNYMVAGLIAEMVAGVPYRQLMRERVFDPLGMTRTVFLPSEVLADGDYASGATVDWTGATQAPRVATPDAYDNAWARPAGYAWSSALDLAKFARFLLRGDTAVLPAVRHTDMQDEQIDTEQLLDLVHYGHGVAVQRGLLFSASDYREEKIVSHNGALPGFSSLLLVVPRTGFGIVLVANTDGAYFNQSVRLALEQFAALPATSTPPELADNPADLDRYLGTYTDPHTLGDVAITRNGNQLLISIPAADEMGVPYNPVLTSLSKRNYLLQILGTGLPLTFILDDAGNPEYLRSRAAVAAYVPEPVASLPRVVPRRLDRRRLERLLRDPWRQHVARIPAP